MFVLCFDVLVKVVANDSARFMVVVAALKWLLISCYNAVRLSWLVALCKTPFSMVACGVVISIGGAAK